MSKEWLMSEWLEPVMHFVRWVGGSTKGAEPSQPRATPWERGEKTNQP